MNFLPLITTVHSLLPVAAAREAACVEVADAIVHLSRVKFQLVTGRAFAMLAAVCCFLWGADG